MHYLLFAVIMYVGQTVGGGGGWSCGIMCA